MQEECARLFQDAVLIAQSEEEPEGAARKLTETAFSRGSADNITCIVVKVQHEKADHEETQDHLEIKPQPNETQSKSEVDSQPEECQQTSKGEPHDTEQTSKAEPHETQQTSKGETHETEQSR